MKEHPILFTGPMVRAILEGRKTQTRRVVKPQPKRMFGLYTADDGRHFIETERIFRNRKASESGRIHCPYGGRLWVRETWADLRGAGFGNNPSTGKLNEFAYRANTTPDGERARKDFGIPWKPSIFMPRAACRLTLEITNVRIERLSNISEEDAQAEGIFYNHHSIWGWFEDQGIGGRNAVEAYSVLWNAINLKRGLGWYEKSL